MGFQNQGPVGPTADSEYSLRSEKGEKGEQSHADYVARTMQEHHDYFVTKKINADAQGIELSAEDQKEYELAMLRERKGIVHPLVR